MSNPANGSTEIKIKNHIYKYLYAILQSEEEKGYQHFAVKGASGKDSGIGKMRLLQWLCRSVRIRLIGVSGYQQVYISFSHKTFDNAIDLR